MINIVLYAIITYILCMTFKVILILSYKTGPNKEKNRAFERGFDPAGLTRKEFCIKFFLVGVVFLIFDVEVRLIIPLPYRQSFLLIFIVILELGLIYE